MSHESWLMIHGQVSWPGMFVFFIGASRKLQHPDDMQPSLSTISKDYPMGFLAKKNFGGHGYIQYHVAGLQAWPRLGSSNCSLVRANFCTPPAPLKQQRSPGQTVITCQGLAIAIATELASPINEFIIRHPTEVSTVIGSGATAMLIYVVPQVVDLIRVISGNKQGPILPPEALQPSVQVL